MFTLLTSFNGMETLTKRVQRRATSTNGRANGEPHTERISITTEAENKAALDTLDDYFVRMRNDETKLTKAEHEHFRLLAEAIEAFEDIHYPLPTRQQALMEDFHIGAWDAETLKAFRKEYSLTQANLAEFLGVAQARVAEMERGKHEFSQTTRIALDRIKHYIHFSLYAEQP
jgi:DNA-binding XRE family transcriptional regulator